MNQTLISASGLKIRLEAKGKKCYIGLALALLSLLVCMLTGASVKVGAVLCVLFLLLAPLKLECAQSIGKWLALAWYLASFPVLLVLSQLLLNQQVAPLGAHKIMLGCLCIGIFLGFLLLLVRNIHAAVVIGVVALMLLTTVNYFVYAFRGSEFAPFDFLALGTAVKVAGEYRYTVDPPFVYAWSLALLYLVAGYCIYPHRIVPTRAVLILCALLEVVSISVLSAGLRTIERQDYRNQGAVLNGYLLNFVKRIDFTSVEIPDGYDADMIAICEDRYERDHTAIQGSPDVIVIMNESFADLRIIGDLHTNMAVMPFLDSIMEDTIHGFALASSIGGGTCNSEYQFLTGNNMGFLAEGTYPYQQYIKAPTYSIFEQMEAYGYQTVATHPGQSKNWMRKSVYPLLGVDESFFIDDHPQENLIRNRVSDREMYEKIISLYENACRSGEKLFLFGVTMQNHGGYEEEGFSHDVQLEGYSQSYLATEQYLSLLHHSDEALEFLLRYFEQQEREVVILFFGDHLPNLDAGFYEVLRGGAFDTLEERMLQYTVPFFVWANYEIDARDVGLTSQNFLSNYIYEAARLPLPAYNAFLRDVQSVIPAMNAFGFYSQKQGAFVTYGQADAEEAEILNMYRILQYNSLFDADHKSEIFFSAAPADKGR